MASSLAHSVRAHSEHSSADMKCPGSPAGNHAWLSIEATLSVSCTDAKEEILARVAGQASDTWDDPHGNGVYTLQSNTDDAVIVTRLSSNKRFTDKMMFTFVDMES